MQAMFPISGKLREHQTRLVFVGSSSPEQMEEFLRSPTVPISGEIYTDPETSLYKMFNMKKGVFRSLVMPLWRGFRTYGMSGVLEGFRLGVESSHLAGDSWIQGGTVLLDQSGKVLYQHQENHPGDWPDLGEVLQTVGINEEHVDYTRAASEWMAARKNARQQS
ncbi:prostamide/prostaglandin F synthase-like isoform X3 [Crassostrea virginica]